MHTYFLYILRIDYFLLQLTLLLPPIPPHLTVLCSQSLSEYPVIQLSFNSASITAFFSPRALTLI